MFNIFKGSSKFVFEFTDLQNVEHLEIETPQDLINAIIELNFRYNAENKQGSMLITKYKITKKAEIELYAQRLNFPMSKETDFDDLLYNFYTKKPLAYEKDDIEQAPIYVESDDVEYPAAPTIDLSDEPIVETVEVVAPVSAPVASETGTIEVVEEQNVAMPETPQISKDDIAALVAEQIKVQLQNKDDEIELLKMQIEENSTSNASVETIEEAPYQPKDDAIDNVKNQKEDISDEQLIKDTTAFDEDISEVIQMVKTSSQTRLKEFVENENKKIKEEIAALDTRDQIKHTMTARISNEQKQAENNFLRELSAEKAEKLRAENERHTKALATIEKDFENDKIARLQSIKTEFSQKLEQKISEEFQRQTEQLEQILQGKTAELQFRQKEVNDGLKAALSELLTGFNADHDEVIQDVEARKSNEMKLIPIRPMVGKKAM